MKDLKITYTNENDVRIVREYNTIMDFIDEMESDNYDIPMMDYTDVEAVFFENRLLDKHFDTIAHTYKHGKEITC